MTRDASAPAWPLPDPFSDEAIRAAVEPHYTWRRALPGASDLDQVRAKSIRLGETATPSQSRESNRISNVVPIEVNSAVGARASQHVTIEQRRELTDIDRKILAALVALDGFATAKAILRNVRGTSESTLRKRLDRLVSDGRIRNVPGQGYELLSAE